MTARSPLGTARTVPPAAVHDDALPGLTAALDPVAATAAIVAWLAESDLTVDACRPVYIRYKPATNATIRYDLELRQGPIRHALPLVARVLPPGRAQRQPHKPWAIDALAASPGIGGLTPVAVLPGLHAVAMLFPVDWKLSGLPAVLAGAAGLRDLDLIRYKPGRKALLRAGQRQRGEIVYAKVFEPPIALALRAKADAFLRAMAAAAIPAPKPVDHVSDLGLTIFPAVEGHPLRALRNTSTYRAAAPDVVALLRAMRSAAVALPHHGLAEEAVALSASAAMLGAILPAQRPAIAAVAERLIGLLAELGDEVRTAHGDFYDDQLIAGPAGLTLIDDDEVRLAHPAIDAGNFLAHLHADLEQRKPESALAEAALAHLTDAWSAELGARPLAIATAAGVLKLATGPFRRLEPNWPSRVADLIDLAEALRPPTPVAAIPPRDPALTGLAIALDPHRIYALLPPGEPALHATPRLVKHRPGRRAVVLHPRPGGDDLYVKVFAGDRAAHVAVRTSTVRAALGDHVASPRVRFHDKEHRLVGVSAVPGLSFDQALTRGDNAAATRVGAALAAFHGCRAPLDAAHSVDDELDATRRQVRALDALDADLAAAAWSAFDRIAARLRACPGWRSLPIHRDCHPAQVLLAAEAVGFIDLDDACLGEPAIDVGNLIAHLDLLELQEPAFAGRSEATTRSLLVAYRAAGGEIDTALLAACRAVSLVRLAGVHAPRSGFGLGYRLLGRAQEPPLVST